MKKSDAILISIVSIIIGGGTAALITYGIMKAQANATNINNSQVATTK